MTDAEPFLKAILADPGNDGPRLIFADWLEEQARTNSDAISKRVAFIRIGCANPRKTLYADNVHHLVERRTGFLDKWFVVPAKNSFPGVQDWINSILPQPSTTHRMNAIFRRGFLDALETPWDWWLAHHAAIRGACPLTTCNLTTRPPQQWIQDVMRERLAFDFRTPMGLFELNDEQLINVLGTEFEGITFRLS